MNTNSIRFDLSAYLIHFFRSVDVASADIGITPENWGPDAIVEDTKLTPLFLLRNAIRLERLWATWSVRNGKRTIYGPNPAVCFTEMPIAAFIEAGVARAAKRQAMSPFALVLPRHRVHASGALPAIYGLSSPISFPNGSGAGSRILPASALPEAEQYRYVTLGNDGKIDWTHEREWRWAFRGALPDPRDIPPSDGKELPGLDLHFPGMGAIVQTKLEAQKVLHDILVLHDRGSRGDYGFILVADNIPSLEDLREPSEVQKALKSAAVDLGPYLDIRPADRKACIENYERALNDVDQRNLPKTGRELGACWLWLTDATHNITRALVAEGRVHINGDGRYLVEVPFSEARPLEERQMLTQRLADLLHNRHGLSATYHSVLGKLGIDDLPHFSDPPLENRLIFNYAHDT